MRNGINISRPENQVSQFDALRFRIIATLQKRIAWTNATLEKITKHTEGMCNDGNHIPDGEPFPYRCLLCRRRIP